MRSRIWLRRSICLWVGCAVLALCPGLSRATTYLVRPDGLGDFPTIQDALTACVDGDVVLLADGTFQGTGNRDLIFHGRATTLRSQSGHPNLCVIDCQGAGRGIYCYSAEGPGTRIEDLSIINGLAGNGGAVYLIGASPTFHNVIFAWNNASWGGAIYT